jgi:hypothetical protein
LGICRFNPPTVIVDPASPTDKLGFFAVWPPTAADDWCRRMSQIEDPRTAKDPTFAFKADAWRYTNRDALSQGSKSWPE